MLGEGRVEERSRPGDPQVSEALLGTQASSFQILQIRMGCIHCSVDPQPLWTEASGRVRSLSVPP